MKKIINKKIVSVCVVIILTLSCIIPVCADDTAAGALTEDDLEQFYTYTDVGDGTWQVGLTAAFKAQVDLAAGGTYTVDGYTWTTGAALPNPAPGGMHKGKAVTSMANMFGNFSKVTSLDLSDFDTSNVTTMEKMFVYCVDLTSLNVSGFDTSNVTSMSSMFSTCWRIASLDLSDFDTSSVTNMGSMFNACKGLTSLDISSFDTSKVTETIAMFSGCESLTSLDVSGFDTGSITDMTSMFDRCINLTNLDVSGWDTSSVTNISCIFSTCAKLVNLDVSGWDTSNVTTMSYAFFCCTNLTNLDVSSWDTSNVTTMKKMFYRCLKLNRLDLSNFDTSSVTDMVSMFEQCSGLTELDLSSFDTSNVTATTDMLKDCGKAVDGTPATGYAGSVAAADSFNAGDGTNGIEVGNLKFVNKVEYTVTFDTDGGSAVAKETVVRDKKATKPADPTRDGYNFQGWYTDETYASEYDFSNGVTGDLTLYAKWEKTASADTKSDIKGNGNDNNGKGNNPKKASFNSIFPSTGDYMCIGFWLLIGMAAIGALILLSSKEEPRD